MAACLGTPTRQPDYRQGRAHQEFVANLAIEPKALRTELARVWQAASPLQDLPLEEATRLVAERYSQPKWRILGE